MGDCIATPGVASISINVARKRVGRVDSGPTHLGRNVVLVSVSSIGTSSNATNVNAVPLFYGS